MRLQVDLIGTSPLVMHNIQLANQRNDIVMQIKQLTSKPAKQKTKDDADLIDQLEFLGGLYHNDQDGIHIPTWNIKRSFEEAAKATRDGKSLMRAVEITSGIAAPLIYDGPSTPLALWKETRFRWSTMVGIQRNKTPRMRPIFREWACSVELELLTEMLDRSQFDAIVDRAGKVEGIGDARKLGYGRFEAKIN